jgi:hypothetical protein
MVSTQNLDGETFILYMRGKIGQARTRSLVNSTDKAPEATMNTAVGYIPSNEYLLEPQMVLSKSLNERSRGDHSQSINAFPSLDPRPNQSFPQECRFNPCISIQTRSLQTLSMHMHAGYAVPRYRKVATPARRSTFCDSHMQTLPSPLL